MFLRIIEANFIEIWNEEFVSKFALVPDTFYFENSAIFDYQSVLNNGKYHKCNLFLRSIPLSTHGCKTDQIPQNVINNNLLSSVMW